LPRNLPPLLLPCQADRGGAGGGVAGGGPHPAAPPPVQRPPLRHAPGLSRAAGCCHLPRHPPPGGNGLIGRAATPKAVPAVHPTLSPSARLRLGSHATAPRGPAPGALRLRLPVLPHVRGFGGVARRREAPRRMRRPFGRFQSGCRPSAQRRTGLVPESNPPLPGGRWSPGPPAADRLVDFVTSPFFLSRLLFYSEGAIRTVTSAVWP